MASVMVRIDESSREIIRELAELSGEPMQAVLKKAIEDYRRRVFLENVNSAYAALRRDALAWRGLKREREDWERADTDGLEPQRRGHGRRK